jgi:hypothetical protein
LVHVNTACYGSRCSPVSSRSSVKT